MKFKALKAIKLGNDLILPGTEIDYDNLGEAKALVNAEVLEPVSKADLDKLMNVPKEQIEPIEEQVKKQKAAGK